MNARSSEIRHAWLGIGPKVGGPAGVFFLLAAVPCWLWHPYVRIPVPSILLRIVGSGLLGFGVALYFWSLWLLRCAWRQRELATSGPYARSRHPAYAAWILLILPGLGLLSGAWPLLIPPLLAYIGFRRHIAEEEAMLRRSFGSQYDDYARIVPCLFSGTRPPEDERRA